MDELAGGVAGAITGAVTGGAISYFAALAIADKGERGRRRQGARAQIRGSCALLQAEIRNTAGRMKQSGGAYSSQALNHDCQLRFAESVIRAAHDLTRSQRERILSQLNDLVGHLVVHQATEIAFVPAEYRDPDWQRLWATTVLLSPDGGPDGATSNDESGISQALTQGADELLSLITHLNRIRSILDE